MDFNFLFSRKSKAFTLRATSGFTLIELLLVIGIIATLAAIVILAINPTLQLTKAQDAKRTSNSREIKSAINQYIIDNGYPPTGLDNTEQEICSYGAADTSGCLNLDVLVEEDYLVTLEQDTKETDVNNLGYTVTQANNGFLSVEPVYIGQSGGSSTVADAGCTQFLALSIAPTSIVANETSTGTVTRCGGEETIANILSNDSFDTDNDGWTFGSDTSRSTVSPRTATHSVLFRRTASVNHITKTVNLTDAGQMSFWYRDEGNSSNWRIRAWVNDVVVWTSTGDDTPYTQVTLPLDAGSNTIKIGVHILVAQWNIPVSSGYIDDIIIQESLDLDTTTDEISVTLSSNDTDTATVPATMTIPENETSATFTITGVSAGSANITATHGDDSDIAAIEVTAAPSSDYYEDFESYAENSPMSSAGWSINKSSSTIVTYLSSKQMYCNTSLDQTILSRTFVGGGTLTYTHTHRNNEGVLQVRVNGAQVGYYYGGGTRTHTIPAGALVEFVMLPNEGERYYFDNISVVAD